MNRASEPRTIVVIDDDSVIRLSCRKILVKDGFVVEAFDEGQRGLEGVTAVKPDLVLVDLKMPGTSGMEVVSRVQEIDPLIVVVVITGYATVDTAVAAMKAGAYDFLPKPFSPDELRLIVNRGIERRRLRQEAKRLEIERELLRRRMVAFVSHQLQAPLAAVHQYLDVMRHIGETPGARARRDAWLERCLARTDEMLALIKDWLSLARVESGALVATHMRVDLRAVILDVVKGRRGMAAAARVSLTADLPERALPVRGDRTSLRVLFENLVENAVKYNKPDGRVVIGGEAADREVTVEVKDTGVGVAEEDRPRLFDEFFRAKETGSRTTPGTGLGLPICRRIVSELGGKIQVESVLGAGSTFRVRLPLFAEESVGEKSDAGASSGDRQLEAVVGEQAREPR